MTLKLACTAKVGYRIALLAHQLLGFCNCLIIEDRTPERSFSPARPQRHEPYSAQTDPHVFTALIGAKTETDRRASNGKVAALALHL